MYTRLTRTQLQEFNRVMAMHLNRACQVMRHNPGMAAHEAQTAVAKENGFSNWEDLAGHAANFKREPTPNELEAFDAGFQLGRANGDFYGPAEYAKVRAEKLEALT